MVLLGSCMTIGCDSVLTVILHVIMCVLFYKVLTWHGSCHGLLLSCRKRWYTLRSHHVTSRPLPLPRIALLMFLWKRVFMRSLDPTKSLLQCSACVWMANLLCPSSFGSLLVGVLLILLNCFLHYCFLDHLSFNCSTTPNILYWFLDLHNLVYAFIVCLTCVCMYTVCASTFLWLLVYC